MPSQKIFGVRVLLNDLADQVSPEVWEKISSANRVLLGLQTQMESLEQCLVRKEEEEANA